MGVVVGVSVLVVVVAGVVTKISGALVVPAVVMGAWESPAPIVAVVVAVGEGGIVDGHEIKMIVKPGDKVLYAKYAGNQFKLDGEEVTIIRQQDILAIVE